MRRIWIAPAVAVAVGATLVSGCSTSSGSSAPPGAGKVLQVAASINVWGSVLSQIGGSHVHETSIITNPDTDPHDYESTPRDGTVIAGSQLFVENGIGYDPWAAKSLAASPDSKRVVLDVQTLLGLPGDANPHRWYSPTDVNQVAQAIATDLTKLDPADASYYANQLHTFETKGLATYHSLINEIQTRYAGVKVEASESIFVLLAQALKLDLITPPSFMDAVNNGTDPSPADLSTINQQITSHEDKVYVFNTQNATPDVTAQVKEAMNAGIPIAKVTETLTPANDSFQQWQSAQLQDLADALHKATGR
ncbi:MAG TPA: zinc ABC transporter substrate-binding protein [Mycobacteriales bacterium]|nr:zinc ABC transporter substrate-binding protein [Mycobacteriales bacterium]